MTRDDISSQAVTYDLIIMAIFAFNIAYLRQMEHIDESEVNDELIQIEDYAIFVQGLPPADD
jgi:hypothetical protein